MATDEQERRRRMGRKGAAVREAKKEAKETDQDVDNGEFGFTVHPDGTVVTWPQAEAETMPQVRPGPPHAIIDVKLPTAEEPAQITDPGIVDQAPEVGRPPSKLQAVQALMDAGWTEEQAFQIVTGGDEIGTPDTEADKPRIGPESIEEERKRLQAAYDKKMETYVPPVLDQKFLVELKMKFADYVRRGAAIESIRRGREISAEQFIDIVVRRYWQNDQDRLIIDTSASGASGPAGAFNPETGAYAT